MMTVTLAVLLGISTGPGIRWIDVGQGAAMLVVGPRGHAILVDSGPSAGAEAITAALLAHGLGRIDLWIHTHLDADHIGGALRVRAGEDGVTGTGDDVEVVEAWDHGAPWPSTDTATLYRAAFAQERRTARAGAEWSVPGLSVRVLESPPTSVNDENARSLILCLALSGVTVLILGDAPEAVGTTVAPQCPGVDALWASHHGSLDGISAQLVTEVRPRVVVISAGRDNPHCHPSPGTLALLATTVVWVLDGAGLDPVGTCPRLGVAWSPNHHLAAGDLWLPTSPEMR